MAGFSMRAGLHGLLLVLLLMPGLAAATLLNEIRAQGRLRVAIAGALPPYNHYTPDGTAQGSDADIARAMARDLGSGSKSSGWSIPTGWRPCSPAARTWSSRPCRSAPSGSA